MEYTNFQIGTKLVPNESFDTFLCTDCRNYWGRCSIHILVYLHICIVHYILTARTHVHACLTCPFQGN